MQIRPLVDADEPSVLRLNAESVWALSPLDADSLAAHRAAADRLLVVDVDGEVAAFAIAYAPGAPYNSPNYRWHSERFNDFVYLDRIVVDPAFRRRGIAGSLYDVIEAVAVEHGRMVCEVNSDPPNDVSLAFHAARGYRVVGEQTLADGHRVAMLEKPL